jgi:hypothetical protein
LSDINSRGSVFLPMTDLQLLQAFEARTLPLEQWTHRTHVRVAYLYFREHGFDGALARLRRNIQAFNATHAIPDTATSGYNETTTQAFVHLIAATVAAYGRTHPFDGSEGFCDTHPQLMTRHALRLFYSPQRRMHPEAKVRFIEPDLAPLPTILRE